MNIGLASDVPIASRYCTCCEKLLRGKIRWLELDQRTYTYHDYGGVPEGRSQGAFVFGLSCAKRMIAEHTKARAIGFNRFGKAT